MNFSRLHLLWIARSTVSVRSQQDPITAESIDNRVDRDGYTRIWGAWAGPEALFYVECARLVNGLCWKDVLEIAAPEARAYARLTQDAYSKLISDDVPPELTGGAVQLVQLRPM